MSKIKSYIMTSVEKQVDKIVSNVKQNLISKETAAKEILEIDNLDMINVDSENVDDMLYYELGGK